MDGPDSRPKSKPQGLHVILFSENSRTITLELKRWQLWTMATVLGVMLVFSTLSVVFVVNNMSFYRSTVAKTMGYKDAIAQYQIKYEKLYEQAYDEPLPKKKTVKPKPEPAVVASSSAIKQASPKAPAISAKKKPAPRIKLAAKTPPQKLEKEKANFLIDTKVTKVTLGAKSLKLALQVQNLERGSKREGRIAAVGLFRDKDGKAHYVAWPDFIKVDQTSGKVLNFNKANRYVIRYFKKEEMNFPKPLTTKGKFEKVFVKISEVSGGFKTIEVPVNK